MKIEIPNSLLVTLSGQTSRGIKAAEVRESDGHLLFTLTDGSKIDLGSVVGPAGTPGTKGDKGEPGTDGYSPTVSVQRTETGVIVTIRNKDGTSYASVSDGKKGDKGDPGEDYVLTSADKQEIAASVVAGGLEVEVSDETPGGGADILICHISGSGTDADPYACDKTSQEIAEAAAAGRIVYAVDDSKRAFPLVSGKPVSASFTMTLINGNLIGYQVKSSTVTYITRSLQDAANRVTALSEESTDAQYPSAKAVYEALQGVGGSDLSLGLTGATVGQIAKITAVDENGKPTAWSPVDMPSGGGEKAWEKLAEITLDADVRSVVISQTDDGEAFSVDELYVYTNATNIAANTTAGQLGLKANDKNISCIGTTAPASIAFGKNGTTGRNWMYLESVNPLVLLHGEWAETNTINQKDVYCWQPNVSAQGANPFTENEKIVKVELYCVNSGSTFASGSKFIVWGR